jgi:hypothetical protein
MHYMPIFLIIRTEFRIFLGMLGDFAARLSKTSEKTFVMLDWLVGTKICYKNHSSLVPKKENKLLRTLLKFRLSHRDTFTF